MSASRAAVQRHYMERPWRFIVQHFGPGRAHRRANGYRHPVSKKLIVEPSINMSYRRPMVEVDTDA